MGWCGPRVCATAHVLWSLAYIACGAIQLVVGVFFLVALPFLQLGSNVWTGAWNVIAGVSGALLACAGPLTSPGRHETLLYLAVSVLAVNVVNLVLLEGLEWRYPAAEMQLQQQEQTRGRLLMYARLSTDAAALVAGAAALIDSQLSFCSLQAARSRRRRCCRQCRLTRADKLAPVGCMHGLGHVGGPDTEGVEYVRVRSSTTPAPLAGKLPEHYPPSWVFAAQVNSHSHADNCRDAAEASARLGAGGPAGSGQALSNGQLPSAPPATTPNSDRTKQGAITPRIREPQQLQVVVDSPSLGSSRQNGGVTLQTFSRTASPGTSTATSPAASPAPPRGHHLHDRHFYEPVQRSSASSAAASASARDASVREAAHKRERIAKQHHQQQQQQQHKQERVREPESRQGTSTTASMCSSPSRSPSPSPRPPSSAMSESIDGSEPAQYASLMSELQHAFRAKKAPADSPPSTATADSTTLEDAASSCSQRFTRELEEALQVIHDLESPGGTVTGSVSGGAGGSSIGAPPPPVPDWRDSDSEDSQSGDSSKTLSGKQASSSSGGYCSLDRRVRLPIGKAFACPVAPTTITPNTSPTPAHTPAHTPAPTLPTSCSTSGYSSPALDVVQATQTAQSKPRQKTVIDICDGNMVVREVNNNEATTPPPAPVAVATPAPASGLRLSALSGIPGLSGLSLLRRARSKNGHAPKLSEELQGAILQSESLVFLSSSELAERHQNRQREIEQRVQQKFYGHYQDDEGPVSSVDELPASHLDEETAIRK